MSEQSNPPASQKWEADAVFVRQCAEMILPKGVKPEEYAFIDPKYAYQIAQLIVSEVRHQLEMIELRKTYEHETALRVKSWYGF